VDQSDDEVNTRVTALRDLSPHAEGEDCLVTIHTAVESELGRRHILSRALMRMGRGRDNDIVVPSDAVSRHHAQLERRAADIVVSDLQSTNGTFINNERVFLEERRLRRGDQLRLGDTVFKYLSGSDIEAQYHVAITHMAVTDGLTNLCNRKQVDTLLAEEVRRAQRYRRELSILMLDVDHFKRINDTHGHLAGDGILTRLAVLLQQHLRPDDTLGRYGGDEFCMILPETSLSNAAYIAESLRAVVSDRPFAAERTTLSVTVSIGAAELQPSMQYSDLYRSADAMLYRAKQLGRNRVCR
jgi:two-component system, cell cycle response regulator